jgi:hypothetical protein
LLAFFMGIIYRKCLSGRFILCVYKVSAEKKLGDGDGHVVTWDAPLSLVSVSSPPISFDYFNAHLL